MPKRKKQEVPEATPAELQKEPQAEAAPPVEPQLLPVEIIPISSIVYVVDNHRQAMDERKLEELVSNIRANGVKQPIKVCRRDAFTETGHHDNPFNVMVFGHRRARASELAGLTTIPAMIAKGMTDQQIAEEQCIENIHREDVGPIGEAHAVKTLMDGGRTIELAASMLDKPVTWCRGRLNLLRLDKAVQDLVNIGRLPLGHATEISKVGDPKRQVKLARHAIGCFGYGPDKKDLQEAIAGDYVEPLKDIRKSITYLMCKMGSAGWPKDCEYAGRRPCDGCPDNTNTEPALFEGITLTSKRGNCTNPDCYRCKSQAWERDPVKKARDKEREKKKAARIKAGKAKPGKREQEKEKARKFPDSPEERFAVALHGYADGLVKAIKSAVAGKALSDLPLSNYRTLLTQLMHLSMAADASREYSYGAGISLPKSGTIRNAELVKMFGDPSQTWRFPKGLHVAIADGIRTPSNQHHWDNYSKRVCYVPVHKKAVAFLDVLEAFIRRRGITADLTRPTLDTFKQAVEVAEKAKVVRGTCRVCGKQEPKKPFSGCFWVDRPKLTLCINCCDSAVFKDITLSAEPAATKAIAGCADVKVLQAAQDYGLKGDWRRAAVSRRIEQLRKPKPAAKKTARRRAKK